MKRVALYKCMHKSHHKDPIRDLHPIKSVSTSFHGKRKVTCLQYMGGCDDTTIIQTIRLVTENKQINNHVQSYNPLGT